MQAKLLFREFLLFLQNFTIADYIEETLHHE